MSHQAVKRHGDLLCDSKYMTFLKRPNYGDNKKISDCQGLAGGMDK